MSKEGGVSDTGEMEKAVCRQGFCLAPNPINIFRKKPNSVVSLIIHSSGIILVNFGCGVHNPSIVLASQFSKIVSYYGNLY